ncbi:MAG: FKBP-type peptidyl-prolyl cis-trans isomerase [Verrucomicrobiota bacterium]
MKLKQTVFLIMGLLPLCGIAQTNKPQNTPAKPPGGAMTPAVTAPAVMPEKGKLSYAIGMYFGNNITNSFKRGGVDLDTNAVLDAIKDVVTGQPTRLTQAEQGEVMKQLRAALQAKQQVEAEEAKGKGEAFLAQFAKSPGVITLSNGLEYKVITAGDGAMPQATDMVTVAYRGTLIDGTEFDSNNNFKTAVNGRIIAGWQKILPLMKVGAKWQVAIPSGLGYGLRGSPPKIPGNSVLVFDLELKSVAPGSPKPPIPPPNRSSATTPSTPVVSGQIIKVPSADELKKGAKIEVIDTNQTNLKQ